MEEPTSGGWASRSSPVGDRRHLGDSSCCSASSTPTTTTSRPSGIASARPRRRAAWLRREAAHGGAATGLRETRRPDCASCERRSGRSRSPTRARGRTGGARTSFARPPARPGSASRSTTSGRTALEPTRARLRWRRGTLLGILHEAQLTGEWSRMKGCRQCEYAFFDRSKNRSAAWCAMSICGNRTKNRAYYRRRRTAAMSVDARGRARPSPEPALQPRRGRARRGGLGAAAILPLFLDEGSPTLDNMILAASYVMMALGLNIVVGFAGLLDLGLRGLLRDRRARRRVPRIGVLGQRRGRRGHRAPRRRAGRRACPASTSTS